MEQEKGMNVKGENAPLIEDEQKPVPYQQQNDLNVVYPTEMISNPINVENKNGFQENAVKPKYETPLVGDQVEYTLQPPSDVKVKTRETCSCCSLKCLMLCGVVFCCCTVVCFCCLIFGGILGGIGTGIAYGVCVSGTRSGTEMYFINDTSIDDLNFIGVYGDFDVVESLDEFKIEFIYHTKDKQGSGINVEKIDDNKLKITGPLGWGMFGRICKGYEVKIFSPKRINLEFDSGYGKVNIENVQFKELKASIGYSDVTLKQVNAEKVEFNAHYSEVTWSNNNITTDLSNDYSYSDVEYTEIVVGRDFTFSGSYGHSYFNTLETGGNTKLSFGYHDSGFNSFITHDISVKSHYNDIDFDTIEVNDLKYDISYGDCSIRNVIMKGTVMDVDLSYSDFVLEKIERVDDQWATLTFDNRYSDFVVTNAYNLNIDGKDSYGDIKIYLYQENYGNKEMDLVLSGSYSDWRIHDEIDAVKLTVDTKDTKVGTINDEGEKDDHKLNVRGSYTDCNLYVKK